MCTKSSLSFLLGGQRVLGCAGLFLRHLKNPVLAAASPGKTMASYGGPGTLGMRSRGIGIISPGKHWSPSQLSVMVVFQLPPQEVTPTADIYWVFFSVKSPFMSR